LLRATVKQLADRERKNVEDAFRVRNEAESIVRQAWRMVTKKELLKIIESMKV
jgi:hypothetical protein